jgi:cytochrome P450
VQLYLLALYPDWQDEVADEAIAEIVPDRIYLSALSKRRQSRAVFRETLRLYPPVPMYVREAARPETFRARPVRRGSQVILSPWHMHRHEWLWNSPDGFDPTHFDTAEGKQSQRDAYIPFSACARVYPASAFAMAEGTLLLSMLVRAFRFTLAPNRVPMPVAQLTLRAKDGIHLQLTPRHQQDKTV